MATTGFNVVFHDIYGTSNITIEWLAVCISKRRIYGKSS